MADNDPPVERINEEIFEPDLNHNLPQFVNLNAVGGRGGGVAAVTADSQFDPDSVVVRLVDVFPDADDTILRERVVKLAARYTLNGDTFPAKHGVIVEAIVSAVAVEYAEMKGKYPKRRRLDLVGGASGEESVAGPSRIPVAIVVREPKSKSLGVAGGDVAGGGGEKYDSKGKGKGKTKGKGKAASAIAFVAASASNEPSLARYLNPRQPRCEIEALHALTNVFLGFYMSDLRLIVTGFQGSIATAVVALVRELFERYERLARAMLSQSVVSMSESRELHRLFPLVELHVKASDGEYLTERRVPSSKLHPDRHLLTLKVMKIWRSPHVFDPVGGVKAEIAAVERWLAWKQRQGNDCKGESSLSIEESRPRLSVTEDDDVDCQCCFTGFPFRQLVQCFEGHLFCRECMEGFAREAVCGQGKAVLTCLTGDCEAGYPRSQLESCLDEKILCSLEEREQEESVRLALSAADEKISQCPHCDFKLILPPGDKVLKCQNPQCMKETCIVCKEDWEEHFGIPCSELETKDEEKLRTKAEERMTAARLRNCHKCSAPLIKEGGCNKMTCRCGAKLCYVCRAGIPGYLHFCQHVRSPGKGCKLCNACSLWSDSMEDDDRAIEEIRREAEQEKEQKGFINDRNIGPSKSPTSAPRSQPPPAPPLPAPGQPQAPPAQ